MGFCVVHIACVECGSLYHMPICVSLIPSLASHVAFVSTGSCGSLAYDCADMTRVPNLRFPNVLC